MRYTALLTRMYTMADESLQIKISDTKDLTEFKSRILNALKIMDFRANTQMRRLFEDSDLTDQLSYTELEQARKVAELMYPLERPSNNIDFGYNSTYDSSTVKDQGPAFEFAKNMASGEVVKMFIHDIQAEDSYTDLDKAIRSVWDIIDTRLVYTNQRELDVLNYFKKLDFIAKNKIVKIMDILFGRETTSVIVEQLKGIKADEELGVMRNEIVQDQLKASQNAN